MEGKALSFSQGIRAVHRRVVVCCGQGSENHKCGRCYRQVMLSVWFLGNELFSSVFYAVISSRFGIIIPLSEVGWRHVPHNWIAKVKISRTDRPVERQCSGSPLALLWGNIWIASTCHYRMQNLILARPRCVCSYFII